MELRPILYYTFSFREETVGLQIKCQVSLVGGMSTFLHTSVLDTLHYLDLFNDLSLRMYGLWRVTLTRILYKYIIIIIISQK